MIFRENTSFVEKVYIMIVFAEFNCIIDNVPHQNFQKMKKLCTLCLNLKYFFFRTVISFSEELQIMFIFCDEVVQWYVPSRNLTTNSVF